MKTCKSITTLGRIHHATALFLGACLVTLVLASAATAVEPTQPDKLPLGASRILHQAQQHFKKTDYQKCCQVLEDYLQTHPDNPYRQFYLLQGNSYFKMKNFKQARKAYRHGLDLSPRDPMLNLNLGLALEKNGQLQPAAEQYVTAYGLQQQPDPQLLYQAAALSIRTERFRRAADLLGRLEREQPPAHSEWLELLLYADYQLQDYPSAIRVTERLLEHNPQKADYWQQLAQLRLHNKQYLKAAAAYEILYRLRKPSGPELEQLAELYRYLNLPLRAAETLERIASDNRSRADLERLARLYWQGGLPDKANRCLSAITERWPDAQAYQLKAELLYAQSAYKQTLQLLETACAAYPEHAELHLQRGFAAWQLEDWDLAARSFTKARRFKRTRVSADAALKIIDVLRCEASQSPQSPPPSVPLAAGIF